MAGKKCTRRILGFYICFFLKENFQEEDGEKIQITIFFLNTPPKKHTFYMSDALIDQATQALASVWVDDHGTMPVSCKQISDHFSELYSFIHQLQIETKLLRDADETREASVAVLRTEMESLLVQFKTANISLESLNHHSTGVVTNSQLKQILTNLATNVQVEEVARSQEALKQEIHGLVTTDVVSTMHQSFRHLAGTLEELKHSRADEIAASKLFSDQTREQLITITKGASQIKSQLEHELSEQKTRMNQEIVSVSHSFKNELCATTEELRNQLISCVEELTKNMTKHAVIIDSISSTVSIAEKNAPTTDEIAKMRKDLDSMWDQLDKAQFRIHEAYSQCLSMAKYAASDVSHTTSFLNSTLLPPSSAVQLQPVSSWSSEPELRVVQRELHRVTSIMLPSFSGQLREMRDELSHHQEKQESRVRVLQRSCGVGESTLVSALDSKDEASTRSSLRTMMQCLFPEGTTKPATVAVRPLVLEVPQRREFALGLDVCDALPLLGERGQKGRVMVMFVVPESAASRAGVLAGDNVLRVGQSQVTTVQQFVERVQSAWRLAVNQKSALLEIVVLGRSNVERTITVPF